MSMDRDRNDTGDPWARDEAESRRTPDESFTQTTVSIVRMRTLINDVVFMLAAAFSSVVRAFMSRNSHDSPYNDSNQE